MSLFRPGPPPPGFVVGQFAWPQLAPAPPGEIALQAASADLAPPGDLTEARLTASRILQEAAEEAEAAICSAREDGFEAGRQEGLAAGHAELERLREQALQELESARAQAETIRRQARAEATAIAAVAEAEAHELILRTRETVDAMLAETREQQRRWLDEAQSALVDLAVASAVRLVQGHLAIQPAAIVTMVAAGVQRLKDADCTLRVSPEELPLLEAQRHTLERELGQGLLQVIGDQGLGQGSYTLTSTRGTIDGRLDEQAGRLRTALQAALGAAAS